jgi:hypothetical protein
MTRSPKHGRPSEPLRTRPYRYALVYYEVMASIPGMSRRRAMLIVQAAYNGVFVTEAGSIKVQPAAQDHPIERDPFKLDDSDFAKHRERCRAIAKRHATKPDDVAWLRAMSEAMLIAARPRSADAAELVLALAASVGEEEWARRELIPMMLLEQAA